MLPPARSQDNRRKQERRLFALGESMGAAIALQSAAIDPRIAGVVAESSFSDLREVSYDYAGPPPVLGGAGVIVPAIPGVAQPSDDLAQSHGQFRNSLQALDANQGELLAIFLLAFGQQ